MYCKSLHWFTLLFVSIAADIQKIDVQQNERIRLECTLSSKADVEEAMWMRIRFPYNPDILTYRDNVVSSPDRFELVQRHLSSSVTTNGTFIDTYFLILTIINPNLDDEGRYVCTKDRIVFAEYDLFIIVPPRFVDEENFIPQQAVVEGSTLHLSCSADGRPMPWITWFYRTNDNKLVLLGDGTGCRDTVCEIYLGNYTRHDPGVIECIADNEKSTRVSKIFNIDVLYPPKIITSIRTVPSLKSLEIFIECSSIANPSPTIIWFDDNRQEITNDQPYTIKQENQTSILSFTVYSKEHPQVLYYCRSNNSIGTVDKLINISDFIQFDNKPTTTPILTTTPLRKYKNGKANRVRSKATLTTTISSASSTYCYSTILLLSVTLLNKK